MSTVAEVESALRKMPVQEARAVSVWLQEYLDEQWDQQMDSDIAAGRLDKVWNKVEAQIAAGNTKPLDEVINDS